MGQFYVYVHFRKDTGAPFYVGKGSRGRLFSKQGRNRYWRGVADKAGGFSAEKVFEDSSEELVYLVEREYIDKLGAIGVSLTNLACGGEGGASGVVRSDEYKRRMSGLMVGVKRPNISKALKGVPKSEAHRKAISDVRRGTTLSEEVKVKMSESRRGRPSPMMGRTHSEDAKRRISEALRGERNHNFGKPVADHVRAAIRATSIGRVDSEETRRKRSESHSGARNHNFGKQTPDEQKARQIATLRARPLIECPHCGKMTNDGNAKRWHFDNCRERG